MSRGRREADEKEQWDRKAVRGHSGAERNDGRLEWEPGRSRKDSRGEGGGGGGGQWLSNSGGPGLADLPVPIDKLQHCRGVGELTAVVEMPDMK